MRSEKKKKKEKKKRSSPSLALLHGLQFDAAVQGLMQTATTTNAATWTVEAENEEEEGGLQWRVLQRPFLLLYCTSSRSTLHQRPFKIMHGSIGNRPLNSRFDPDSPLGEYSQCTVRRISTYTSSNRPANLTGGDRRPTSPWATWTRCGLRPKTVYRLLGPDACSDSGPSAGPSAGFGNDMPVSPVALPHKALALLGMQEASGFGSPSSPEPRDIDLQSEFADDSDSDETQHHPHRLRCRYSGTAHVCSLDPAGRNQALGCSRRRRRRSICCE